MEGTNALVLTVEGTGNKLFAVHASGCADLAKRNAIGGGNTLNEMADRIALNYGGYGDGEDKPLNAAHALSWATVKACAKAVVK